MALLPDALQELGNTLPLPEGAELRDLFAHELLVPFLQRSLLEALASHAPGLVSTADESQLVRLARLVGMDTVDGLDRWCQRHGVELSTVQTAATFPARLQAATAAIWSDDVPGRFLERRSQLDQAVLSVLRFDDADLAQELYFQMVDGDTVFAQLVDQYGQRPGQPPRALVGPVSLEQLHPLLARVAECYEPGALIPPLDLNGCVHLIRVEQLQKATLDEGMHQRLLLELRQQWLDQQLRQLLERLAGGDTLALPAGDTK